MFQLLNKSDWFIWRVVALLKLEQMDIEIHEMPVKDRDRFVTRVKSYRAELSKLEKDLVGTYVI